MTTRFVLVEPSHPGNIGAAARALRVMGLTDLVLVRPARFPHADATAMAAGADDVLEQTRVYDDLEEAIADCAVVYGTSARRRSLGWPELDARAAAAHSARQSASTAFVFGRERSGLTNRELDRCQYMLHVPSAADYGSLNLAQAVQVVAYECRMRGDRGPAPGTQTMPTRQQMEYFFDHLHATIADIGFLDPAHPRKVMRRLRRLFNRTEPSAQELDLLRGILKHARDPAPGSPTRRRLEGSSRDEGGDTMAPESDQQ